MRDMKRTFKLIGLDCANCAAQLENAIQKIEGIESVSVSFIMGKLVVEYKEELEDEIIKKIKKVVKREEPDVDIQFVS